VAHVGDSRLYLLRDHVLEQLTEDHVDEPGSNLLTRCVGVVAELEVDVLSLSLQAGDKLLLCTDGLWDLVDGDELGAFLHGHAPAQAVEVLVRAAVVAGGHDNITVVLVEVTSMTTANARQPVGPTGDRLPDALARGFLPLQPAWFSLPWALLGLLGLVLVVMALIF
jgi:serine/threonine protein phosphatase PrpC